MLYEYIVYEKLIICVSLGIFLYLAMAVVETFFCEMLKEACMEEISWKVSFWV